MGNTLSVGRLAVITGLLLGCAGEAPPAVPRPSIAVDQPITSASDEDVAYAKAMDLAKAMTPPSIEPAFPLVPPEPLAYADPFEPSGDTCAARQKWEFPACRRLTMPSVPAERMRLVAIVKGGPEGPTAMIEDDCGLGHTVTRGHWIGKPKELEGTGRVSMTINWRVEEIRDRSVLLTRGPPHGDIEEFELWLDGEQPSLTTFRWPPDQGL